MATGLRRPVPVYDPGRGLLFSDHFQIAYATNDADRAVDIFRQRFGATVFRAADNAMPNGAMLYTRTVWIGARMYEICQGCGPGLDLYTDMAPADGPFVMRLHHLGFIVADDDGWSALWREIERGGWCVRSHSDIAGFGRTCTIEAPELGHFLEFIQPREGLAERLNATPVA